MKKVVPILLTIGFILCTIIGYLIYTAYEKYSPTKEKANAAEVYQVSADEAALFFNNEQQQMNGLYQGGEVYLPHAWVAGQLNERYYWDAGEQLLVYALPERIEYIDEQSKDDAGKPLMVKKDETVYMSLGLISKYTNIRTKVFDDGEARRVFIDDRFEPESWNYLEKKGAVRVKGGIKSPILESLPEGGTVRVLKTMDRWVQVRTEGGHLGYIEKSRLGQAEEVSYLSMFQPLEYQSIQLPEKVCLVWHQVTTPEANQNIEGLLARSKGVNVVSPTWFALTDNEGNFTSLADQGYVDYLHNQGIAVWALIDNFSKEVNSEVLLSKTSNRKKLIEGLIKEVNDYGLDGINLDFEGLREEAGPHYVQFIRELSVACRNNGTVLSVDNHVPASYNAFYNLKEQGVFADYVIIMGYDEHYSGGEAGPVASYDYVKKGIEDTLKSVPAGKTINAIPFYTRVWIEDGSGSSSEALGIADAKAWVERNNVALYWQDEVGLYYGEYSDEASKKEIWMEEEKSLSLKMDLIRQNQLAGVACWKLGFEPDSVWDVIWVNE